MLLHDNTIAHVAKLIQMAILTGTDIVDHLRMVSLEVNDDDKLIVNKQYEEIFNEQISKMLSNSQNQINTPSEELKED